MLERIEDLSKWFNENKHKMPDAPKEIPKRKKKKQIEEVKIERSSTRGWYTEIK